MPDKKLDWQAEIIQEANRQGRFVAPVTTYREGNGRLLVRADQHGYLAIEVWLGGWPYLALGIGMWNFQKQIWQSLPLAPGKAENWLAEAEKLIGVEEVAIE